MAKETPLTREEREAIANARTKIVLQMGGSILMVGLGFVGGFWYNYKRHSGYGGAMPSSVARASAHTVAWKAFALGSLLCVGTFAVGIGAFVLSSGITTPAELQNRVDAFLIRSSTTIRDQKLAYRHTSQEELDALRQLHNAFSFGSTSSSSSPSEPVESVDNVDSSERQ